MEPRSRWVGHRRAPDGSAGISPARSVAVFARQSRTTTAQSTKLVYVVEWGQKEVDDHGARARLAIRSLHARSADERSSARTNTS